MVEVSFSVDLIKARAESNPWRVRDDFNDEIDLDEMGATVIGFSEAAESASHASELAEMGSQSTAEAARLDSETLFNALETSEETYQGLQNGGDAMSSAAGTVVQAANLAYTTQVEVEQGVTDLETTITQASSAAISGYNTQVRIANTFYSGQSVIETNPEASAGGGGVLSGNPNINTAIVPSTLRYDGSYHDHSYWVLWDHTGVSSNLHDIVRDYHIEKALEEVESANEEIEELIEQYRADLTSLASELQYYGYEPGSGGVSIWFTEEMGEYHAGQIQKALETLADNPEDETSLKILSESTALLGSLAERYFDENGEPIPGLEMTPREAAYLENLFRTLTADDLVTLGHLPATSIHPAITPEGYDYLDPIRTAQMNVGNGILMLLNPEMGGLDPLEDMPESIHTLMYDLEVGEGNAPGFEHAVGYDPDTGEFIVAGMYEYQGFAALMAASTVQPGAVLAEELGASAIRMQQSFNSFADNYSFLQYPTVGTVYVQYPNGEYHSIEGAFEEFRKLDIGATGVLDVTSRNVDGSQNLLLDDDNLAAIIGLDWGGHDAGAISVFETATERGQQTELNAEQAAQIANNTLTMVGSEPATWRAMVPKGSAMNDALLDLSAQYIDAFDSSANSSGKGVTAVEGGDGLYYGSFQLPGRDEEGLGFLEFVGLMDEGADEEDFLLDPDFARLHAAADLYFGEKFAEAIEKDQGGAFSVLGQKAGALLGNLLYAEGVSAATFAQDEFEVAALAHARREIITNTLVDMAGLYPGGRVIASQTAGIADAEVKALTQKVLNDLLGTTGSASKEQIGTWVEGIFGEKPDENEPRAQLLSSAKDAYAEGRTSLNRTVISELAAKEIIDEKRLRDEGIEPGHIFKNGVDGPVFSLGEIVGNDDRERAFNGAIDISQIGDFSLGSGSSWDYAKDIIAPLPHHNPESRGEVNGDLVASINHGR